MATRTLYDAQWSGTVSYHSPPARWVKVTKTYADLSAAALTNDIEVFSLPAGWAVHTAFFKTSAAFTGGAIAAYTLSVGPTGSLLKYVAAFDALQAIGNTVAPVSVLTIPVVENWGAATSIRLSAISTVANLSAATAGSVDVYLHVGPVS